MIGGRYGSVRNACRCTEDSHDKRMTIESDLLDRITCDPNLFGGKPVLRGRRVAVEHILDLLAAGDDPKTILSGYPFLEPEDIRACLVYASKLARHERIERFALT